MAKNKTQGCICEMLWYTGMKFGASHCLHALIVQKQLRDSATYWTRKTEFLINHKPKISIYAMTEQTYLQY